MSSNTIVSIREEQENLGRKIRVAILGAGGIGKIHARIFHELGLEVCSILSSTDSSGINTSRELKDLFNIHTKPFTNLNKLLSESFPDAVSVCTPMELHFENIIELFNANLPVFCEKPLFWSSELSFEEYKKKIEILLNHPNRALFVNNSSASYINFVDSYLKDIGKIETFKLQFYTTGSNKRRNIAEDLLPHGLAMLEELLGKQQISKINEQISNNRYTCNFNFDECFTEFDFVESKKVEKKFLFSINDLNFLRIQEGDISSYKVYLNHLNSKKVFQISDPFELYISRFIKFCKKPISDRKDDFDKSAYNMELMAKILLRN